MKKFTKERHIVFQEDIVTEILVEYLKKQGEVGIPPIDEIGFSYDEYKNGNEITLMFDDGAEEDKPLHSALSELDEYEDIRYEDIRDTETQ